MILESLILNGLQLIPSNNIYIAKIDGLFDSTNTNNLNDLISDGSAVGTTKINSKTINMQIAIQDTVSLKEQIKYYKHLNYLLNEKSIKIEFKFEGEDDYFYIECVKESISYQEFDVIQAVLIAPNPYILKRDFENITLGKRLEGGFSFYSIGYNFNQSGFSFNEREVGNDGIVVNDCYNTIFPLISIKGDELKSVTIENKTTGESIAIDVDIKVDEELFVDCRLETRGVYKIDEKGIKTSVIRHKRGTWISLISGENHLEIKYTGSKALAKVNWRETWV